MFSPWIEVILVAILYGLLLRWILYHIGPRMIKMAAKWWAKGLEEYKREKS